MKPEDLKISFEGKEHRPFIHDRILCIPKVVEENYSFPGWHHPDFFGNDHEIHIEYCSGNGGWIASKAAAETKKNWVAVEMKFARTRKIWSKIKNLELSNLFIIHGEGYRATVNYFPSASVHKVYINFPDPWPKRYHAKNRIIQQEFVDEMARILIPKGTVTFVTDDPNYSEWSIKLFNQSKSFVNLYPSPFYISDWNDYGSSYFDNLWREKGKTIRYHHFIRN